MTVGLSWQLARRNIRRRRTEALLVVLGSMLGTAIIAAAFVVGDSFDGSIRDSARTTLGPVDEIVRIRPEVEQLDRQLAHLVDVVAHSGIAGVDGLVTARTAGAVLANGRRGDAARAEPDGCVLEVGAADARRFGGAVADTGMEAVRHDPAAGTAILNADTADVLHLRRGDRVVVHAYGRSTTLRVADVVPQVGLAGFCSALVPPGTIVGLAREAAESLGAQPPSGLVLVSNDGGVFDSAGPSARIATQLRSVTSDLGAEVDTAKADTLDAAERSGRNLQTLFTAIGGFSVMAGILLLINLFVMLAEERKVELGVLRAIGLKRIGVWRAFSLEGLLYASAAAVLGAVLGVGMGELIILGTNNIFRDPGDRFSLFLVAKPATLALAATIGLGISMLTVLVTSVRISRLNVIAAVRDLPDPRRAGRRIGRLLLSAAAVVGGMAVFAVGVSEGAAPALLGGPALALFGVAGLLVRVASARIVTFTMSAFTIVWCLTVFALFPSEMDNPSIGVFVEMGLVLVAAAVTIATTLDLLWDRATLFLTERGKGLATRLALAYPLARRFRTGMLLGMFSLVIFTMTFLGAFAAILGDSATSGVRDVRAGFDLLVDSNRSNPLTASQLEQRPEVADAATLVRGRAEFTIRYQRSFRDWPLTGFDDGFLRHRAPILQSHDPAYPDDRATFAAVLVDPTLVIVNGEFLQDGSAPAGDAPRVGDRVVARNGAGREVTLRVAGVLRSDFAFHGALVGRESATAFLAPAYVENRQFVALRPGQDAEAVAARLTAELVDHGADAQTFRHRVDEVLSHTTGFIRLMQMYLGVGLLIGIAGLGVVMVRAVRERRREIGMLRAMGVGAGVVRRSFLLEAAFIAVQAVLTGVGLGLVTADQVVVNSGAFSQATVEFVIPWATVALIAVVPVAASLIATASPARRAAAIRPAVALRATD